MLVGAILFSWTVMSVWSVVVKVQVVEAIRLYYDKADANCGHDLVHS